MTDKAKLTVTDKAVTAKRDKELFDSLYFFFLQKIEPKPLMDYFYQQHLITDAEYEKACSLLPIKWKCTAYLISLVVTNNDPEHFDVFYEAVSNSQRKDLFSK